MCHVHACVLAVKCDSVVGPALPKLLECWLIASESPARVRLVVRSQHYPVVLASKLLFDLDLGFNFDFVPGFTLRLIWLHFDFDFVFHVTLIFR